MTKIDRFSSVVLIAVLAATAGWAASSFTSRQNNASVSVPQQVAANVPAANFVPADQPVPLPAQAAALNTFSHSNLAVNSKAAIPAASLMANTSVASPVLEAPTTRAAVRPAVTRPRVVNPQAYQNSRSVSRTEPRRGMSNTMKNTIAIGGGAAVGAIIGGIAGGKKGAAIGALLGGGGAGAYTWIKHKKGEPVF